MKIIDKRFNPLTRFGDLWEGAVFVANDVIYMKMVAERTYNAVILGTGKQVIFNNNDEVQHVDSVLTIESK